jgi:hypothetical protein
VTGNGFDQTYHYSIPGLGWSGPIPGRTSTTVDPFSWHAEKPDFSIDLTGSGEVEILLLTARGLPLTVQLGKPASNEYVSATNEPIFSVGLKLSLKDLFGSVLEEVHSHSQQRAEANVRNTLSLATLLLIETFPQTQPEFGSNVNFSTVSGSSDGFQAGWAKVAHNVVEGAEEALAASGPCDALCKAIKLTAAGLGVIHKVDSWLSEGAHTLISGIGNAIGPPAKTVPPGYGPPPGLLPVAAGIARHSAIATTTTAGAVVSTEALGVQSTPPLRPSQLHRGSLKSAELTNIAKQITLTPAPIRVRHLLVTASRLTPGSHISVVGGPFRSVKQHAVTLVLLGPGYRGQREVMSAHGLAAGTIALPAHMAAGTWSIGFVDLSHINVLSSGKTSGEAELNLATFSVK